MEYVLSAAQWFGAAVCHQFPDHSYQIAGVPLPLCARCTGLYLGALLTMTFLARLHPRAVGLPRPWVLVTFVLFFFAWAGDGVNSFLAEIPSAPHLYLPSNLLRLITGTLMGITIGSLVFVILNSMVWREVNPAAILATRREFLALLALAAVLVSLVQSGWAATFFPLSFAILIAILLLHTALTTALVSNYRLRVSTWRELSPRIAIGVMIAVTYLSPIAWLHGLLIERLSH